MSELLGNITIEDLEKVKLIMSLANNGTQRESITLRVFCDEYLQHIKQTRSSSYFESVELSMNHLLGYFEATRTIGNLSLREIDNFSIYLQQKVKKGYLVYFRNLKAAFNRAKEWNYIGENFFTKVRLPKKQRLKPIFLTETELDKIVNKIHHKLVCRVIVFAFHTGLRLNELTNLRWKNVDFAKRVVTIGDEDFITKSRKQRFIPLNQKAYKVLEEMLLFRNKKNELKRIIPIGSSFVFSKHNGKIYGGDYYSRIFKKACRSAKMDESIHFHTLRHSFASHLAQKGVSLYIIKELLGHSSIQTTEIYAHLNLATLKEAIER